MKDLKVSYKMKKSIERLEKQYGKLEKQYGTETHSINIENSDFYCYCELSSKILNNLHITVAHDGIITY